MPHLAMLTSSSPQNSSGASTRAMALAKLRESFALHQVTTEPIFQKSDNSRQQHDSPKQRSRLPYVKSLAPPNKQSDSNKEAKHRSERDSNMSLFASRNAMKLADNLDSGSGSTSTESDVGLSTPGISSFSCDSAISSPDEGFHVSKEVIEREGFKTSKQFWGDECELNRSPKSKTSEQANCSPPSVKRSKISQPLLAQAVVDSSERKHVQNDITLSQYDVPVDVKRKTVPLAFSMSTLANRTKKLIQQQQKAEILNYRKFRAKISPAENKTAEDELRKEVRYFP